MKRKSPIIVLFLALCLFLAPLSACGQKNMLSYGSARITEGMYRYAYAAYKFVYLSDFKSNADTEAGWQTVMDNGKTAEENFRDYFGEILKSRLVAASLYENSRAEKKSNAALRAAVENLIADAFLYTDATDKDGYNRCLAPYGITYDDMFLWLLYEYEYHLLYTGLYGKNGNGVLTDPACAESVKDFYTANYLRVRVAYVKTGDTAAAAAAAYADADNDTAFDRLIQDYAENDVTDFIFYRYGSYTLSEELLTAIAGLSVGDNAAVTEEGGVCYLRRYATNEEYQNSDYSDFFTDFGSYAAPYCYSRYLRDFYDNIKATADTAPRPSEVKTIPGDINAVSLYLRNTDIYN